MDTSLQGNRGNIKVRWWLSGSEPFKLKKLDETFFFFFYTEFYTEGEKTVLGVESKLNKRNNKAEKEGPYQSRGEKEGFHITRSTRSSS